MQGVERDGGKTYNDEYRKSTRCNLKPTKAYSSIGCTIVANNFLASVNTAVAFLKNELHFVGDVQNGHFSYPKTWVKYKFTNQWNAVFTKKTTVLQIQVELLSC